MPNSPIERLHRQLIPGQIHTPFQWIWENEEGRSTVTSANTKEIDVGKIGYQKDNAGVYMLMERAEAVVWKQLNEIPKVEIDVDSFVTKDSVGTAAERDVGTAQGNVPEIGAGGKLDKNLFPQFTVDDITGFGTAAYKDIVIVDDDETNYTSGDVVVLNTSHKIPACLIDFTNISKFALEGLGTAAYKDVVADSAVNNDDLVPLGKNVPILDENSKIPHKYYDFFTEGDRISNSWLEIFDGDKINNTYLSFITDGKITEDWLSIIVDGKLADQYLKILKDDGSKIDNKWLDIFGEDGKLNNSLLAILDAGGDIDAQYLPSNVVTLDPDTQKVGEELIPFFATKQTVEEGANEYYLPSTYLDTDPNNEDGVVTYKNLNDAVSAAIDSNHIDIVDLEVAAEGTEIITYKSGYDLRAVDFDIKMKADDGMYYSNVSQLNNIYITVGAGEADQEITVHNGNKTPVTVFISISY